MEPLQSKQIFKLKEQIQYKEKEAVKQVALEGEGAKLLLVAIDHAELPEHPAPSRALVTVLEGEGELVYEGETFKLKEQDNFLFEKGALHSVTSDHRLKFSLLFI